MIRRRTTVLAAATILLFAGSVLLESQCILSGWWKGEAFWRWRPTSYWLREVQSGEWLRICGKEKTGPNEIPPSDFAFRPGYSWIKNVDPYLPANLLNGRFNASTIIMDGDMSTLPVLLEMRDRLTHLPEKKNGWDCKWVVESRINTLEVYSAALPGTLQEKP